MITLDQCNYHGYRDALLSGDYTNYLEKTVPGRPGSMTNCLETDPVTWYFAQLIVISRTSCMNLNIVFLRVIPPVFGVASLSLLKPFFTWRTGILLTIVYVLLKF
jgi:hypothetical protein